MDDSKPKILCNYCTKEILWNDPVIVCDKIEFTDNYDLAFCSKKCFFEYFNAIEYKQCDDAKKHSSAYLQWYS